MNYKEGLNILSLDPKLIGKLCDFVGSMPNIEFPTMGGLVFWDTLYEANGWKLQKNKFTDHCRVIDPNDTRKAWGSENIMKNALENLANVSSSDNSNSREIKKVYCPTCGKQVSDGNFCKECGSNLG